MNELTKLESYAEQQRRWELLHPPIPTTITVKYKNAEGFVLREYVVSNTIRFPDKVW